MKLRNKKTGEIVNAIFYAPIGGYEITIWKDTDYLDPTSDRHKLGVYSSLSKLNEEWEDYTPAEPLIKDEKIRKAVRAWAEACGVNRVVNGEYDNELCAKGQQFYGAKIVLTKTVALPRGRNYTIAELCGEEEEC